MCENGKRVVPKKTAEELKERAEAVMNRKLARKCATVKQYGLPFGRREDSSTGSKKYGMAFGLPEGYDKEE